MATKIEKAIRDLLYEHDYIMIPGFGAFIVNYIPAEFSSENNSFSPPVRTVSFNSMLKQDDGLITTYLSRNYAMSIDDAKKAIAEFASQLKQKLSIQKSFSIEGIGNFILNTENNIVFEPTKQTNYFTESFGFEKFYTLKTVQKNFTDIVLPTDYTGGQSLDEIEIFPVTKKRTGLVKKLMYAAPVVALGAGLVFMIWINPSTEREAQSNINPIEHIQRLKERFDDKKSNEQVISVTPSTDNQSIPQSVTLVVESFSNKEEAIKFHNELVLTDFSPFFIEENGNFLVKINTLSSDSEVISQKIKQLFNKNVVLEKK